MWILGTTGLVEGAERYALLFGLWTAFVEVIPYIGPWLSAIPPAVYALVVDPVGVLWVAALFVFIYQIEGHVVVPNVMASALRLHPLLVIFGLLAGGALYGIPGVLVALPTMAAGRAIWEFFGERIELDAVGRAAGAPARRGDRARTRPAGAAARSTRAPGEARGAYPVRMSFPATRLRRLRRTDALRALVRETSLSLDDVVMPLFACPGEGIVRPVAGLSGIAQRSVDELAREAGELARLGVRAVLLFGIPESKDAEGSGAWDDDGIVQRALRALRAEAPGLTLLTDVCLCEYTDHGHCGLLDGDTVANDETLDVLARTAVSHVEAGADAVCPSDMMDGRVGALRAALPDTPIVSYAAKYASAFYGPFREVAESTPSFGDRRGYQMDPANGREALRECALDLEEGADVLMVKPALPYLDVVRAVRERFDCPVWAYQVSGEYAMVRAAAEAGHLDERTAALEALTAIKRAGAGTIVTLLGKGPRRVALSQRTDRWRRATSLIPGGVSSPVRAMRAVGLDEPVFVSRGEGAWIEDAEGGASSTGCSRGARSCSATRILRRWQRCERRPAVARPSARRPSWRSNSLPRSSTPSLRSRWSGSSAPAPRRR